MESAFHTEIHRYALNGVTRIANSTDIAVPDALAPVVRGVVSLHSFPRHTLHHVVDQNLGGGHAMVPYDFAAIYNVAALWNNGYDGPGQTIAIAGRTNMKTADVTAFRSLAGLPVNNTQIIVNGNDPGFISGNEEIEAALDVEWSGAVARGDTVKLVIRKSTINTDGVDLSASTSWTTTWAR